MEEPKKPIVRPRAELCDDDAFKTMFAFVTVLAGICVILIVVLAPVLYFQAADNDFTNWRAASASFVQADKESVDALFGGFEMVRISLALRSGAVDQSRLEPIVTAVSLKTKRKTNLSKQKVERFTARELAKWRYCLGAKSAIQRKGSV